MESRKTIHQHRERKVDIWLLINISFYFVSLLAIAANAAILLFLATAA